MSHRRSACSLERTPRDPFRPPLYPYAVAALTPATGDAFAAARLIANLSAAALALLAFGFARRLAAGEHGVEAGLWAFGLVAFNPNTWILGQHATTDMPFAALAGTALLAALDYLEQPRFATAAVAALAWALAAMTRGNAALLLPGLVAAWWMAAPVAGPSSGRGRWLHLAAAVGLACLVMLPHWILRARTFGSPFYDENWKNLAWKLDGLPRLVAPRHPARDRIVRQRPDWPSWCGRARRRERALAVRCDRCHPIVRNLGARARVRRRGSVLLAGSAAPDRLARRHEPGLSRGHRTAFFAWGRLVLVLLPIGAALGAAGAMHAPRRGAHPRRLVTAGLALLALVLAVKTAGFRLPAFVRHHPYEDVAALRRLEATVPRGVPLAGTSPFLDRYLTHPYIAIPTPSGMKQRTARRISNAWSRPYAAVASPISSSEPRICAIGRRRCSARVPFRPDSSSSSGRRGSRSGGCCRCSSRRAPEAPSNERKERQEGNRRNRARLEPSRPAGKPLRPVNVDAGDGARRDHRTPCSAIRGRRMTRN
jgi:hypothetical protein